MRPLDEQQWNDFCVGRFFGVDARTSFTSSFVLCGVVGGGLWQKQRGYMSMRRRVGRMKK